MLSFGATGEVVDVVGLEVGGGGKLAAALLNDFSLSISCNSCSLFLLRRKKNIAPPIIAARAMRPIARPAFAPGLIPPALGTAVAELEPEVVSIAASLELVAIVRVGANVEVVKSRSLLVVGAGVEWDDDCEEEDEDDEGGRRVVVGVRCVVGSGVGSGVGVSVSSSSLVSVGLGLLVDRVGVSNGGNGVIFGRSSVAVEYPPIGPENVGFAVT